MNEDMGVALSTEAYSPARAAAFWASYQPGLLGFMQALELREDWVCSGIGEAELNLVELITYLPTSGRLPEENVVSLMRVLSALPYGQSIHALLWMDARHTPAVRDVLAYTYEHRESSAAANILWQRLERVARFQVLSGLLADLTEQASPAGAAVRPPLVKAVARAHAHARELPHLLGSRRLSVMPSEDTLPFLQEPRTISSLNEVDELFGNRRFYLLSDDLDLCKSLAAHGVGTDQYGAYVTRGPACDFDKLDRLLPYVARRSITPLFGDLIPHSSWGSNLSRLLTRTSWDRIRRPLIESTGHRCEICGARESNKDIDCHEQWEYHEPILEGKRGVQRLLGFWVMCSACHATQHLGRGNGRMDALERLRRIGRMSEREAHAYRAFVFDRRTRRSKTNWVLDVSLLADSAPLIVNSAWTLDAAGFLNRENSAAAANALRSQTGLLGASWRFAGTDTMVHSARAVEDGYYQ